MNNIIVIILFILVIILFINDMNKLLFFREGQTGQSTIDLPIVLNTPDTPKHNSLPAQKCETVTNMFVKFTTNANGESYLNWDDVPAKATSDNISKDICKSCPDKVKWKNGKCKKL